MVGVGAVPTELAAFLTGGTPALSHRPIRPPHRTAVRGEGRVSRPSLAPQFVAFRSGSREHSLDVRGAT
jgi:hypothetical protein